MEFLSYGFLQKALVMGILSGTTCGALGVLIVLWRIGFMGMCISHAAFAGALLAVWAQVPATAGALLGSLAAAGIAGPLSDRPTMTPDSSLSVLFSIMLGIAMLALGMLPNAQTESLSFLWGNLLTTTATDIALMALCALVCVLFVGGLYKEIQASISQRKSAQASGVPAQAIYYSALVLIGVVVAIALKAIGGLLIYSLMVTPAVTALQLCYSLKHTFCVAALAGALSSIAGLWVSYCWAVPAGVAVVMSATALLAAAFVLSPKRKTA